MKKHYFLIMIFIAGCSNAISAQTYIPVAKASTVQFFINHLGLRTEGSFSGISGDINFNPNKLKDASFEMSVNAASIFTSNKTRDGHLKSRDYFYVEKFPFIYLISKSITKATLKNQYWFDGELIIKDLTHSIKFLFTADPIQDGYQFKTNFRINRRDYLIGNSSLLLSNMVDIEISVQTTKKYY